MTFLKRTLSNAHCVPSQLRSRQGGADRTLTDVTVEAGYLAARLGLSVARLRAEMRRGIVYSAVERGVAEDAGRLRLTVRYRARAWMMVVQRDGTLSEAP